MVRSDKKCALCDNRCQVVTPFHSAYATEHSFPFYGDYCQACHSWRLLYLREIGIRYTLRSDGIHPDDAKDDSIDVVWRRRVK